MAKVGMIVVAATLAALVGSEALAQKQPAPAAAAPAASSASAQKPVPVYIYMADGAGNRLLLQTQFSMSNPELDVRALRRFQTVVAGLEQRGFKRADVTISDWDKKEKFAKCYIYLEDASSGKGKDTGARVWCSESGISEVAVNPSEDAKHADKVLERFTFFLNKAKDGLKS
ncbi:MAG TPA: hypothetical protein VNE58_09770 [Casimicrobiaceae bacterium]|nr:hypothetical protein [Casimicrobiaceae bacterium]